MSKHPQARGIVGRRCWGEEGSISWGRQEDVRWWGPFLSSALLHPFLRERPPILTLAILACWRKEEMESHRD